MRQQLLDLYEIQKIDLRIRDQGRRQQALPERLHRLQEQMRDLSAQLAQLQQQRTQVGEETTNMRRLVEEEALKIRKWESRLNDIRNQREYQALLREIESSRRQNRGADEKIGELQQQHEELDARLVQVRQRLAEEELTCRAEAEEVARRSQELDSELAQEEGRRDELAPKVPRQVLRRYEAIRARRQGHGLSAVIHGCCSGCNMRLPPQLYNVLQRVDTIEQCPCCHRLILWDQILADGEVAEAPGDPQHAAG